MIAKENTGLKEENVNDVMEWLVWGIHFFLSAIFAGGVIFSISAPFGVAMVAASGAGVAGVASLIGASLGYLLLHNFSLGLRYISACILIFSMGFCFYDVKVLKKPWVMAGVSSCISAVTGFVYLSFGGWTPLEVFSFLGELVVIFFCAWSFYQILAPLRKEEESLSLELLSHRVALMFFACGLLLSVSGLMLWKDVSLGRSLAVLVILTLAWREGIGAGAIAGVCAGIALDLVAFQEALYATAWGFSNMCAGFFKGKARLHSGLTFFLANGSILLWGFEESGGSGILYEVFFGTLLFCFLPISWLESLPRLKEEGEVQGEHGELDRARRQLEGAADAFRLLGETLKTAFRSPSNQNDVGVIFHRTAQKVCQKCYLRNECWEKDYYSTRNVMNDASSAILARGRAEGEDFSLHFANRCLHFPQFLNEVNHQLTAFFYRRQYQAQLRESRVAVCQQYGQLSMLLEHTSEQLSEEIHPQVKKTKKLGKYLQYMGIEAQVSLVENSSGLLQGEILGEETAILESQSAVSEMASMLQVPLRLTREGDRLLISQLEPFMAVAGFASWKKEGERVCGDKSTCFKREDGKLFVLVCDGMGSGEKARGESTLASELLEQFLKAGVDSLQALHILNGALALRGEAGGGFTTVDLLELNLLTAQGVLYKYGAAPSYFRRGKEVRRIVGKSMPAGADFGGENAPDQIKLSLEPDDYLVLVSDGVSCGGEEDLWLCDLMKSFSGEEMKDYSRDIIEKTPEGGKDDRTAVVLKISLREGLQNQGYS
ncbi:MAG: SpoIIE family protein phosphatase [Eubacteriales bacterium]